MKIEKILVPVDFSDCSMVAAARAAGLAAAVGAEMRIFHALDLFEHSAMSATVRQAYEEDCKKGRWRQLDQAAQDLRDKGGASAAISTHLEAHAQQRAPVDGIAAYAKEWAADLVVLGSHGECGDERFFGSVALGVAGRASCPVLVCRTQPDSPAGTGLFEHPLVAIDYSEYSLPAAELGVQFAVSGAIVEMIHVVHRPEGSEDTRVDASLVEVRERELMRLKKFAANLDLAVISVALRAEVGSVAAHILEYAENSPTDLIIVGAQGQGASATPLGTISDRILRCASVPVMVLPNLALTEDGNP